MNILKQKNKYIKVSGLPVAILVVFLFLTIIPNSFSQIQSNTFGNTFIHSNGNMTVFGEHKFENASEGTQPGIIGTERIPTFGYFNFATGSKWTNALNTNFVDGYVRFFGNSKFVFPIGDNNNFRPCAISGGGYVEASYFGINPTTATTSDIRGGMFPVLPATGPFNSNIYGDLVTNVSEYEYWDINGIDETIITLTWDANSKIGEITSNDLERLTIVGWDGSKWVAIPSYIDSKTISIIDNDPKFNGAAPTLLSGSISTDLPIAPSDYEVYTLAASCINMTVDVPQAVLTCYGNPITLTASSYENAVIEWSTGETGDSTTVFPFQNTTYTVTATIGSCSVEEDVLVQVKEMNVELGIDTFACSGSDLVITATGTFGGSYQWEHQGVKTFGDKEITLENLNTPSTLYVTITDSNGCTDTDDIDIDIRQSPDVFTGRNSSICQGDTTFIQAFGAENGQEYEWSTGAQGDIIYVGPMSTTTYEVSLTDNGCTDISYVTVEVFPSAFIDILNDSIICLGEEVTIETENSGGTFIWSTGETTPNITVTPQANETYSVTVTTMGNCNWTDEITFIPYEETVNLGEDISICAGEAVNLDFDGLYDDLIWSTGETTQNINVSPTTTSTYTVTATYNSCTATNTINVNVDANLEVDLGEDIIICRGETVELSSDAFGQYQWDTGENTTSIEVTPFATRTYSVTVTSGTCIGTDEITVTVSQEPAFIEILNDPLFCLGQEVTVETNSSAGEIEWSNGATTPTINILPLDGQTYSVTTTNSNGCIAETDITFEAFAANQIDLGEDKEICIGENVQLEIQGNFDSAEWSNGSSDNMINVSPLVTTNYSVTTTLNGCESVDDLTVNVINVIDIDLGEDIVSCANNPIELSINNVSGYFNWSTGQTGNSITVFPNTSSTFGVTVTSGNCEASDEIDIIIEDTFIDIVGETSFCPGESVSLGMNSSVGTYEWSTGVTQDMITVTPVNEITYSVTVTSDNGCTSFDEITLTPIDETNVDLGEDIEICEGGSVIINLDGQFDQIIWSDGSSKNSIEVSPSSTSTYAVTATIGNCSNSDSITVNVVENFNVDIGIDKIICDGDEVELSTNSGGEHVWSTGETTPTIIVSPGMPQSYSVTVTSGLCSASDEILVDVEEIASINIIGDPEICIGDSAELFADGPDGEYIWNNGEIIPTITVTPSPNEIYTVTYTSFTGCVSVSSFTFESFSINSVDLGSDISVCENEMVTLELDGTYDSIIWSNGETDNQVTFMSASTETFGVTATKGTCTSSDEITVNVLSALELDLGSDQTICSGQSIELNGNVAGTYLWEHGGSGNNISVSPTTTTTYIATVTSGACEATDQITINVENEAYVNINSPSVYCEGEQITLEAEGSIGTFEWSTGQNGPDITFAPTSGETYYVTISSNNGCVATDSITLSSFSAGNIDLGDDITTCQGESITLQVEGIYDEITWEDGSSQNPRVIIANQSQTYSVTASLDGCTSTDEVNVIVNSSLNLDLGEDINICQGDEVTLTTTLAGSYLWSTGEITQSITVSPTSFETFGLTITSGICSTEDQISITVDDSFVDIEGPTSFCEGEEVTLEAISSGGTYQWSTGATSSSISLVPIENVNYRVTVTSPNGCTSEDVIVLNKFDNGDISLGPDITICEGSSVTLQLEGDFDSVIWDDDSSTNPTRIVSPTQLTTYHITAQKGDCISFDQITIFVEDNIDVDLGSDIITCSGLEVEIGDQNVGGSFLWSTGDTTATITVSPNTLSTYSVTVTSQSCVDSDEITVDVSDNCNIDLYVQKTVDDFNPKAGDTIEFMIILGNDGGIPATNIEVNEEIRSGFKFISSEATNGTYNVNTSTWYVNQLLPSNTAMLIIKVEVLQNGDHSNSVSIEGVDQDDDDPEDDEDDIVIEVDVDEEEFDNTSEIGDVIWNDLNANGSQEPGETFFEDIEIELYSTNNLSTPIATTFSGENGYYCFTGLSSGNYFIKYLIPDTLVFAPANKDIESLDSDVTGFYGPGTTSTINLAKNEQNKDIDVGLYKGGTIGDLVWKDQFGGVENRYDEQLDGVIEGVKIYLYKVYAIQTVSEFDTLIATTLSDVNGKYSFDNLQAGKYILKVDIPEGEGLALYQLHSPELDNDFKTPSNKTDTIVLAASEVNNSIDVGFNEGTVPLTLLDFWGERIYEDGFNRLFWITATEVNTDKFIIERSINEAANFEPIGEVEAAGNSSGDLYYTFDDLDSRYAAQYYYRLKMVDLNGSINYSRIIVIEVDEDAEAKEEIEWKIFPVPTTDFLTIEIGLNTDQIFKGFLVNNLGQHVRTFDTKQLIKGRNLHTIDVIDLAQGQYYLNFYVGEEQFIAKVLVLD